MGGSNYALGYAEKVQIAKSFNFGKPAEMEQTGMDTNSLQSVCHREQRRGKPTH